MMLAGRGNAREVLPPSTCKTGEGAARLFGSLADVYAEREVALRRPRRDSLYLRAIEANPKRPDVLNNRLPSGEGGAQPR